MSFTRLKSQEQWVNASIFHGGLHAGQPTHRGRKFASEQRTIFLIRSL